MDILSNLVVVSENLVPAEEILLRGGYTEAEAVKTIAATGFERLSRFSEVDLGAFLKKQGTLFRGQTSQYSEDISAVVVVTQTNLNKIPNAASMLQKELGLAEDVICYEIVDGCNGFVKALHLMDRLLDSGRIGVIFAGEMNSLMVAGSKAGTAALFGDGFALTIVRKSSTFESLIRQRGAKGEAIRFGEKVPSLEMDGFEIFSFATSEIPLLLEPLSRKGFSESSFPVLHQASKLIVDSLARKIGMQNLIRLPFNAGDIGNLGPGSIPSWLAQQISIEEGARLVSVGFGSGLSWGYATSQWKAERNEIIYV